MGELKAASAHPPVSEFPELKLETDLELQSDLRSLHSADNSDDSTCRLDFRSDLSFPLPQVQALTSTCLSFLTALLSYHLFLTVNLPVKSNSTRMCFLPHSSSNHSFSLEISQSYQNHRSKTRISSQTMQKVPKSSFSQLSI